MLDLTWEDPPAPTSARKYGEVADALRAHPKKWAVWPYPLTAKNAAYNLQRDIRTGARVAFPRGEFEAAARVIDGEYRLFVRFIGQPHATLPIESPRLQVVGS